METQPMVKPAASAKEISSFIAHYLEFEKQSNAKSFITILEVFRDKHYKEHLCDKWKGYEKDFGRFFLNLSPDAQISWLFHHKMAFAEDLVYKQKLAENQKAALFATMPAHAAAFHNTLLFFNNHGICEDPTDDGYIHLDELPAASKRYGNSTNWGNYFLKTLAFNWASERLLEKIVLYYPTQNKTKNHR
jgi:hypothetical protein